MRREDSLKPGRGRRSIVSITVAALGVTTLTLASSPTAVADATSLTITPATQTVALGTAMTTTSVTATPGPVINQVSTDRTVRTLAGPSGAGVSPTNVTTTELDGIRGVVQDSSGDFYALLGTTGLARIDRASGAVTALTYTPGASITGQGLGIDSSDRLYVQQDDEVVQLTVSGTNVTETGAKATFASAPTAFQVTGGGRVYGLFAGGVITTADISTGTSAVSATGYLVNGDWGGTAAATVNDGPTGLYVQEAVAGDLDNAQVYVITNWGALVLQVEVDNGVAQVAGAQRVSPITDVTSAINTTTYSPTTMDGAGNLYWIYQNCVRMLPAGTAPRESVAQVGQIANGLCAMVSNTGSIASTAGYVDGTVGTSRINAGWVSGDAASPPAAHGGLVIDVKGTNPTGRLMIADTNNDALRSMDRVGWSVSPDLYNGLTLNSDGSISGTPTGTSGLNSSNNAKTYTLSYANADGSVVSQNTTITLVAAPSTFTYQFPGTFSGDKWFAISDNVGGQIWGSTAIGEFAINQPITVACPSTLGTGVASPRTSLTCGSSDLITDANLGIPTANTWSISPALPTGVSISATTGEISGTPTVYSPMQTYTVTAQNLYGSATTTFSFGVPQPETVTFDANGGSGSMSPQTSLGAANLNANSFTPPTGLVFTGWNTQANGSGTSYADGASYPFTSSETLYAQWTAGYFIQFDPGTGATGSIPDKGPYLTGTPGTADGQYWGFTAPSGKQFSGWNTQANGSGDYYWFGARLVANSNVTLYAQWVNALAATYTYTYDQNGGTWSGAPTPTVANSSNSYMPSSENDPNLSRTGWAANGWNTKPDGSGGFIAFTDPFVNVYNDLTMYANWYAQVTYDANNPNASGNAPVDATQYVAVQTVTVEGANALAVPGYVFDSWNTQANGSGTSYDPGDTLTLAATGNLTLYAQWAVPGPTIVTPPSNASVNAGSTATFTVSATASAGSLSYQWEVKPYGSGTWSNVSGGSGANTASYTTPTLAGSDDQNEYRVVVTDSNGSTTSSAATLTVISSPGAPGQPTAVAGNAQATVTVVAPGSGSAPSSYLVTSSPGGQTCTVSGASGSCTVTGLTNGTSYTFTSTATNSAGTSAASPASAAVTPLAPPGTPGAPNAVVVSATSATITITPPSSGGTPASYTVTASGGGGTCTVTSPATSCTITGLTSGGTYTFTSTATNVGGTSAVSAASSSTTLAAPGTPGTPTAVAGAGSATVTVVAPGSGGPPTTYLVTASGGGGQTCTVTAPATSCVVGSLTPGTSYTFTATATNGVNTSGSSAASNAVTPSAAVAPGTPGTPTAVAGDGQAVVTIVAPSSGGAADSYLVTAAPGGQTCTVTSPATSCTVTGLTNGTAYTFTSTATNSIGTSGPSAASSPVTPVAAPGTPGAPSAVVTSTTSSTVTITPPSSGGPPVTYTVTASGGGGQTCTVTAPATSCVVTGLTANGSYTFTATATNGTGTSSASPASSSVTLSVPGIPGAPTAVAGTQSATVTIAAPSSGGTVSSYTVTSVPSGGSCVVTVPATSCVVTGLTGGTAYTFTSTATNGAGTSAASAASNSVTPASGGGGGGGGGSSTPTTPTVAPSTPAAPVATTPVAVPASVTSGSASVVVGGQTVTPTVTPINLAGGSVGNAVSVSGPGFQSTVSGPSVGGSVPSGSVTVVSGQPVAVSTSGFAPGASVQVWLMPSGTPLGSLTANASGILNTNVTLPAGAAPGSSAIQVNGAFASGGLLSVSVGVTVASGIAPVPYSSGALPQVRRGAPVAIDPAGQPTDVEVARTAGGGVRVSDGSSTLVVQATTSTGTRVPANAQGSIVVEDSQLLQVRGTNLAPNSEVGIWVFSDPVLMGVVFTDAKGAYQASLPVPQGLPVGEHTLQTNGTTRSGERLSVSLGLVMKSPGGSTTGSVSAKKKSAKASVYFGRLSARLDARDKVTLNKLVKSVKGTPTRTIVIGYVQGSGTSANDISLSRQRAIAVAQYLRSRGLDGRIVTQGKGVLNVPSDQARRVDVTITYVSR